MKLEVLDLKKLDDGELIEVTTEPQISFRGYRSLVVHDRGLIN